MASSWFKYDLELPLLHINNNVDCCIFFFLVTSYIPPPHTQMTYVAHMWAYCQVKFKKLNNKVSTNVDKILVKGRYRWWRKNP